MANNEELNAQVALERHKKRVSWEVQNYNYTLAAIDPEFVEAKSYLIGEVILGRSKWLPLKTKALLHAVLSSARGARGTKQHIQHALNLGITKEEFVEALEVAFLTFGGMAVRHGIDALDEILNENPDNQQ